MAGNFFDQDNDIISALLPKRRKPQQEPLDEEQESSLLGDIGNATLSGVGAVGNFLDLSGSSVRDALAGKNPLDQWLPWNLTSSEHRTSGRDLLRQHNLIGKKDTWGNFFGGMAAEAVLDPTILLGPGALSKTGKLFQGAGMLDDVARATAKGVGRRVGRMTPGIGEDILRLGDTAAQTARRSDVADVAAKMFPGENLDDLLKQPLQKGLFNYGLPFDGMNIDIGTGKVGKKVAGYLDKIGGAAKASFPGRVASMLFDPAVENTLDPVAQDLARKAYAGKRDTESVARHASLQAQEAIAESLEPFKAAYGAEVRAMGETMLNKGGSPAQTAATLSDDMAGALVAKYHDRIMRLGDEIGDVDKAFKLLNLDPTKLDPAVRTQMAGAMNDLRTARDALKTSGVEMGGKDVWLGELPGTHGNALPGAGPSPIRHMPRNPKEWKDFTDVFQGRQHAGTTTSDAAREVHTGLIPEEIINQILMDPNTRPHPNHDPAAYIHQTYGQWLGHGNLEVIDPQSGAKIAQNRWAPGAQHGSQQAQYAHAEKLAKYIEKSPQRARYTNFVLHDEDKYIADALKRNATLTAVHEQVFQHVNDQPWMRAVGARIQSLNHQVFDPATGKMKTVKAFIPPGSIPPAAANTGVPLADAYKQMGLDSDAAIRHQAEKLAKKNYGTNDPVIVDAIKDGLKDAEIPEDLQRAMQAMKKLHAEPGWLDTLGGMVDKVNNFTKSWLYLPFPSSAGRNLLGGTVANAMTGYVEGPRDMFALLRRIKQAHEGWRTGDKNMSRAFFINNVFSPHNSQDIKLNLEGIAPGNPLNVKQTISELATAKMLENTQRAGGKPALSAAQKAGVAANTVLQTGAKNNALVEWVNRGSMYLYLTEDKGWTPAAAARKVEEIHFNYSPGGSTEFEKQVASRMVLFYKFQRGMAPLFFKTLAKHPGGAMAQTVRAERLAAGNDPTTPDYVAGTLAIPNPLGHVKPDGSKSYITGFGLPFEQTLAFAEGAPNPQAGIREALAQTTPLIKAPIEWATGQSLFQTGPRGGGRELEDLDPTLGRTAKNVGYTLGLNEKSGKAFGKGNEAAAAGEFVVANSPASRFATTARQLSDPRKSIFEKALNFGSGVRVSDVSPQAQDAVLRQRLAEHMKRSGAVEFTKTYFRKDDKAAMDPAEAERSRRMDALMTELAKRAKERKKATGNK